MRTSSYGKNKKTEKQKPQGVKKVSDMKWLRLIRKLKPYNIQKGLRYLKHYGVKEFLIRLSERMEPEEVPYGPWREQYCVKEEDLVRQRNHRFSCSPKISVVVPAYRTPEVFLRQMIESLERQSYPNWELVIGNASPEDETMARVLKEYTEKDTRVKNILIPENIGIAENTNAALAAATGEFVGFMDHDDLLSADALFEIAIRLEKDPSIDVFYTDEDKVRTDLSEYFQPHFKPDFNLDLLRSNNYICHFFVVRRKIAEKIGGLRPEYNGAQDYDFIFRCTELAGKIVHIPRVLYHWRVHSASTADNPASKLYAYEAGKKAIEGNLLRCGETGTVTLRSDYGFYDVEYQLQGTPLVSILIPNKDHTEDLNKCVTSILERSTWKNIQIIVIENNSEKEETFHYYEELEKRYPQAKVVTWDGPFNYSAINNFGAKYADGDYFLLLNNDTEVITPEWLENMMGYCQREDVGIVGAKLLYPDNTVQHAGVVVGIAGFAGHILTGYDRYATGYLWRLATTQDESAVTGACLMVKRSVFEELHGLDESFAVGLNDIDFCLRARALGKLVVFTPEACLYHYESKSRGLENTPEKKARLQKEVDHFRERYRDFLKKGDPYYNPNLTLRKSNFALRDLQKEKIGEPYKLELPESAE